MITIAALLACVILTGLAIFQLLLIAGKPLGRYAWGGGHEVLPLKFKIGSVLSIFLYFVFATIILERAGLVSLINNTGAANVGIWALAAYFFIGILMNIASRSKYEKFAMTPVAILLTVLCLIIALS